jgi:acyl-coenzyme A synthetase/AMP-(fatty) acid ligase
LIIDSIFQHARFTPDKPAIYYQGYTISYGEFAYWISDARRFLAQQGLRRGSIAVLLGVPCRLDAWALGFALRSLGMDTLAVRSPEDFAELNMRNIGCVITTILNRPIPVPQVDASYKVIRIPHPFYLGKAAETFAEAPHIADPPGGHILLTSGTTGTRKKVLINAGSLANRIARHCDVYSISERSVVNLFSFAMWTGAGFKLPLCAWSQGGSVIFHHGEHLHRSLLIDGISHAVFTPTTLTELLSAPADEILRNPDLRVFVAGAPLTPALAAVAEARLTPELFTFIASTEAGIWALTRIESPEDLLSHQIHSSTDVQIVDQADRPLTAGQMGAIRVRTVDGVSGYLDDEAASREFFRGGYFYPGDLGEFRGDGRLVLKGRASSVISVRGIKMAAEPIEQGLQERLGADFVCVLSMPGEGADDEMHVIIQSRRSINLAEAAESIGTALPGFPQAHIHFAEAMPRNEMGKIDRLALKQHISAGRSGFADIAGSRTNQNNSLPFPG